MGHDQNAHAWGQIYELNGASYRECTDPECNGHQEWICMLDRWSDAFETPSPRRKTEDAGSTAATTSTTEAAGLRSR